ncbi:hypothetical protein DH2020_019435 [Rehmannia glutinosa]|uniref:YLP motif-containing protein n=1 Tax=Rehmannia glutinosa TaxID=99300 RepID=A0ABR0WLU3_REHGL
MEYPWRPTPPSGNFCPVCSNSHFPFCPPPLPQYFRPPPPPPDQFFHSPLPPPPPQPQPQPSYDPFVDHQGGPTINPYTPPPAPIPPRPWNGNPNFSKDYYGNSNPGLDYDNNGPIGVKRMRFNNVNDVGLLAEDERRLKLIRDHGAVSHGLDRNYDGGYRLSNHSFEPSNKSGNFGDHFQGIEGGYRREVNSHMQQNYGERQFAYQHIENDKNVELGRSLYNQSESNMVHNHGYGNSVHEADRYKDFKRRSDDTTESWEFNNQFSRTQGTQQHIMEPKLAHYGLPNQIENLRHVQEPQGFKVQPPLPTSPPPPLPAEPPRFHFPESVVSSSASRPSSLFPYAVHSSSSFQSPYNMVSEAITSVSTHYTNNANPNSGGYYPKEIQAAKMAMSKTFKGESEKPSRHPSLDKPKVIDGSHILKHPHRANRPDHIVVILRGLPGSGKSYLAKFLRDLEVENGGSAPRIHSMDEYFMTEVEKVEENEGSRSSGSVRGKKPVMKKVMEYCYEPEMEEAYRSSMLKAFRKTLDEGAFPFVIVDDRNLRVADFAQFWATAKRSGYEVYLLEATYKDPAGCAARNVHGFTQNEIHKMASQWEEAPSLYMKLDIKVDMDTEDGNYIGDPSGSEGTNIEKVAKPSEGDLASDGRLKDEQKRDDAEERPQEVVKELGKSKWSNDLDEDDLHKTEATKGNSSALSSLIKSYSKKGKSVRWADQIGKIGFSIGHGKTANVSLVIGAGSGYNLKSNPLPEEEKLSQRSGESRKGNIFQEQLRAEREAFRAVFDKRKHRIRGLDVDDE